MTNEEAISYLNTLYMALAVFPNQNISLGNVEELKESVSMAINALSAKYNHIGKCDRCGGEIYPNTLCIECNDYLAKSVFAEEIKQ